MPTTTEQRKPRHDTTPLLVPQRPKPTKRTRKKEGEQGQQTEPKRTKTENIMRKTTRQREHRTEQKQYEEETMPMTAEQCQTKEKKQSQQQEKGQRGIIDQLKQTTPNKPIQIRIIPLAEANQLMMKHTQPRPDTIRLKKYRIE